MDKKWHQKKENQPAIITASGTLIAAVIAGVLLWGNGCFSKTPPPTSNNSSTLTSNSGQVTINTSNQTDNHSQITNNFNFGGFGAFAGGSVVIAAILFFAVRARSQPKVEDFQPPPPLAELHKVDLEVKATMELGDCNPQHENRVSVKVRVVNKGRKIAYVQKVAATLQRTPFPTGGLTPISSEMTAPPGDKITQIAPDGGVAIWEMICPMPPPFETRKDGVDDMASGYVEITTGEKFPFEFPTMPPEAWDTLAKRPQAENYKKIDKLEAQINGGKLDVTVEARMENNSELGNVRKMLIVRVRNREKSAILVDKIAVHGVIHPPLGIPRSHQIEILITQADTQEKIEGNGTVFQRKVVIVPETTLFPAAGTQDIAEGYVLLAMGDKIPFRFNIIK